MWQGQGDPLQLALQQQPSPTQPVWVVSMERARKCCECRR